MTRALLVLALAACVAPKPLPYTGPPGLAPASAPEGKEALVCRPMADTGSMIAHDECVTRDKSDDDKDDARQLLNNTRSTSAPNTPPHNPNQR
jgi:hypothetical protein